MLLSRFVVGMLSTGLMVLGSGVASGQDYPNKTVRIVTTGAGGGSDLEARIIAQGLSGPLGQQVIVDNRATGFIAAEVVAKAPPDGYTVLLYDSSLWIRPFFESTPYDVVRDFSPITMVLKAPVILVVHPSLPVKSSKEVIALAKAKPGVLNYSSGSEGTITHLAAELFKSMADVNIARIPYKSTGPALTALLGDEVQLMFSTVGAALPHVKLGRLMALAVTSAEPSGLLPGLPTVAASAGLPGYEALNIEFILAPAKTPAGIIKRLNQEIVRVLNQADVKKKFLSVALETNPSSPEELAATLKSYTAKWGKLIKDAGIRSN